MKVGQRVTCCKAGTSEAGGRAGQCTNPEEDKAHGEIKEGEVSGRLNTGRVTETSTTEQSLEAGCSFGERRREATATALRAASSPDFRSVAHRLLHRSERRFIPS